MNEGEIRLAAFLLMKQHGDDAENIALSRADELLAAGDYVGCTEFIRIARAIRASNPQTPRKGEGTN